MDIKGELIRGLTSKPKFIPSWFRYDKQGSVYNDLCLSENHHYYLHRSELEILHGHIDDMVKEAANNCVLVDFGSGNSVKTRYLIDAFLKKRETLTYIPVDISTGHSENFYTNAIYRLNGEYGADIDLTKFKLIGAFQHTLNPEEVSKLTVGWRSIGEQDIEIPGLNLTLHFSDGEFLNLYERDGTSCKYTMDQIRNIVHRGNNVLCKHWIGMLHSAALQNKKQ